MSLLQPKNNNQFPPGGFGFEDPKTGFKCVGYEGTPQMHAVKIRDHRRANPKFYPTGEGHWFDLNSIVQEIYQQKVRTHPYLFKGYPDKGPPIVKQDNSESIISPTVFCECGSNEWEVQYCRSCSGKRITGRKCKKCGKEK